MFMLVLVIPAVLALITLAFAGADNAEEYLYLKLFGHALLAIVSFNINQFPLPIGYGAALLMAANAATNKRARRVASTASFAIWLLGHLFL